MLTVQNRAARCKKRRFDTECKKNNNKKKRRFKSVILCYQTMQVLLMGEHFCASAVWNRKKKSARKLVDAITCDKVKGKSRVRPAILFKAAVAISLGARQTAAIPVPMRIALSPSSSPLGSRQMSRSADSPRENRCASPPPDNGGDKRLLKRPKGEMRVRNNIYARLDGLCHQSINRLFFQQLLS